MQQQQQQQNPMLNSNSNYIFCSVIVKTKKKQQHTTINYFNRSSRKKDLSASFKISIPINNFIIREKINVLEKKYIYIPMVINRDALLLIVLY